MEEQLATGLGEGQVAKLVENHQIEAGKMICQPPLATGARFGLKSVHQVDHIEEFTARAAANAGADNADSEMILYR
jgi:hypothetical protein